MERQPRACIPSQDTQPLPRTCVRSSPEDAWQWQVPHLHSVWHASLARSARGMCTEELPAGTSVWGQSISRKGLYCCPETSSREANCRRTKNGGSGGGGRHNCDECQSANEVSSCLSLLRTFPWLPCPWGQKPKSLAWPQGLCDLFHGPQAPASPVLTSSQDLPCSLCSSPTGLRPVPGPLHLLFPLPGTLLPPAQTCMALSPLASTAQPPHGLLLFLSSPFFSRALGHSELAHGCVCVVILCLPAGLSAPPVTCSPLCGSQDCEQGLAFRRGSVKTCSTRRSGNFIHSPVSSPPSPWGIHWRFSRSPVKCEQGPGNM